MKMRKNRMITYKLQSLKMLNYYFTKSQLFIVNDKFSNFTLEKN